VGSPFCHFVCGGEACSGARPYLPRPIGTHCVSFQFLSLSLVSGFQFWYSFQSSSMVACCSVFWRLIVYRSRLNSTR
jgi:hypothetical protein